MNQETWYVTTIDTFMSGWGEAEGLTNMLIFLCDSLEEAEAVFNNAVSRSDQRNVRLHSGAPHHYQKDDGDKYVYGSFLVQIKTKEDYPRWYEENAFA